MPHPLSSFTRCGLETIRAPSVLRLLRFFAAEKFPTFRFLLPFHFPDWQAARSIMNRVKTIAQNELPMR